MFGEVVNAIIFIVSVDLKRTYGWTEIERSIFTVKMCHNVSCYAAEQAA
jgi:hypothetical protein